MRDIMRRLHYSIHTEKTYFNWVVKYVHFYKMQEREVLFVQPEKKARLRFANRTYRAMKL